LPEDDDYVIDQNDDVIIGPIAIEVPSAGNRHGSGVGCDTLLIHSFAGAAITRGDFAHFVFLFITCFLFNGALPSISTYILLPYGNEEMLVISNIGNIANPLTCIFMMFLPFVTSLRLSAVSTLLTLLSSTILTYFAIATPPLVGQLSGSVATGVLWVLFKIAGTVARVVQANVCKSRSKEHLFLYGAVTQAGSFFGALIFFILCNYTSVFVPAYADC
jgi:riboflavin transporter 2